jgi:predicted nucleic acid-binding protein
VTFVDTNVIMYAVGRAHPLKEDARRFFEEALRDRAPLATSAEVLQEILHCYLAVNRLETLDAALELVESRVGTLWPLEAEDVQLARSLAGAHGELGARDLVHLACCRRRGVEAIKTFDRPLAAAFRRK